MQPTQIVRGAAGQVTRAFADRLTGSSSAGPAIGADLRLWYNPGRQPGKFYGPGMFVLVLSINPSLLAALAMAREGDQKTILQVYVSSISAHEFLIGKIVAGMVLGAGQCLLALAVIITLFGLRIVGDPTPLLVGSGLFLFCVVSFGTLVGAVNANTAQLAQGYAEGALAWLNQYGTGHQPARVSTRGATAATDAPDPGPVRAAGTPVLTLRTALLYNPGLVTAWFIVTGNLGVLIILNGSLVSAATMVREKETGTVEQLLMTPTSALEVVTAKMVPVFVLLMGMVVLVLTLARLVFGVPFRGSMGLVVTASALCVLTGISIGTLLATFARSATQAQLMSFFVNPPLAVLSGALTPIDAMPKWIQPLTLLNPVRHFAAISRGVLIKGVGLEVVYPQVLALLAFTVLLVGISVWRFRRQLG